MYIRLKTICVGFNLKVGHHAVIMFMTHTKFVVQNTGVIVNITVVWEYQPLVQVYDRRYES